MLSRSCCIFTVRFASTASSTATRGNTGGFPFPAHPSPTPHQIFHLAPNATQDEIKGRYYDLVRQHHPDSASCRSLSPTERHARFQAIRAAYDTLTRKHPNGGLAHDGPATHEIYRRSQMYQRPQQRHYRHAEYANANHFDWNSNPDTRRKDTMILGFGIAALCLGIAPHFFFRPWRTDYNKEAARNLAVAREEAGPIPDENFKKMRAVAVSPRLKSKLTLSGQEFKSPAEDYGQESESPTKD